MKCIRDDPPLVIVEWGEMPDVDGYETNVEAEEELVPNNSTSRSILQPLFECFLLLFGTSSSSASTFVSQPSTSGIVSHSTITNGGSSLMHFVTLPWHHYKSLGGPEEAEGEAERVARN